MSALRGAADFRAGNARLIIFEEASVAALEAAVNAWFQGQGTPVVTEQRLLQFDVRLGQAGAYMAFVLYTD